MDSSQNLSFNKRPDSYHLNFHHVQPRTRQANLDLSTSELKDNRFGLFWVTKFMVIYYGSKRKIIFLLDWNVYALILFTYANDLHILCFSELQKHMCSVQMSCRHLKLIGVKSNISFSLHSLYLYGISYLDQCITIHLSLWTILYPLLFSTMLIQWVTIHSILSIC